MSMNKKETRFAHYLPLIILLLYCLILYTTVYFFSPCQNLVDYFYVTCVDACLYYNDIFFMFDRLINEVLPIFVIIIFSITLLLHVLWQKYGVQQLIQWRKQRKMTFQLLSMSFLYLIFVFSFTLVDFMLLYGLPVKNIVDFRQYALYLHFFMMLFLSFICVLSLPELRMKFINVLYLRRQVRRIDPATFTV